MQEPRSEISEASPSSRLDAATLAHLMQWEGRQESAADRLAPEPLAAMAATLDREPEPGPAAELPPLWHWLYFLPRHRQSELGEDGHPRRGGFLPPVPLPRRMWAGGRLKWQTGNPLQAGQAVQRHSRIASVRHKSGRSGELVFVTVQHALHNEAGLALEEEHDIVYRGAAVPGEPQPAPGPQTKAQPGSASCRPIRCCCSAIPRSPSTATASTTTAAIARTSKAIRAWWCTVR